MPRESAEKRLASLLGKYAGKGSSEPELALERDIAEKIGLGRTREQAIDELYEENRAGKLAEKSGVVSEEQKIINGQEDKLSTLTSRVDKLQEEMTVFRRNFKVMLATLIFAFLIMGGLLGAVFVQTRGSSAGIRVWHFVQEFSGVAGNTTSVFDVVGESWRITWSAEAVYPEYAIFAFFVYPEGETEKAVCVCTLLPSDFDMGEGESYPLRVGIEYLTGAGRYYIVVFSSTEWHISVESYH